MSHNGRESAQERRGTVEARKRRPMRPTLMALEDRRLLSTFTVTSTLDNGSAGTPALGGRPGELDRGRRDDHL